MAPDSSQPAHSRDQKQQDRLFLQTFVNRHAPSDELTTVLQGYRKGSLQAYGDELALDLAPDLSRRMLIAQVADGILWRLDAWLLAADNEEIDLLDELCTRAATTLNEQEAVEAAAWDLTALGLAHVFAVEDRWQVIVPRQIRARLAAFLDDPAAPRERSRVRVVCQTADALAHLYGVYPPEQLLTVLREVCRLEMDAAELDRILDLVGWDLRSAWQDPSLNLLIDQELNDQGAPQDIWLLGGDRPFWLPDPDTLARALDDRTDTGCPAYLALQAWIEEREADADEMHDYIPLMDELVLLTLTGSPLREIALMLREEGIVEDADDLVVFSTLYLTWRKSARLWILRGARPADDPEGDPLSEAIPDLAAAAEWMSSGDEVLPDDLQDHERPPGRNELCPCGSGRKYKYCCGRDEPL